MIHSSIPAPLKPGDTIGIVATARKISKELLQPAIRSIEAAGFQVRLGENIFAEDHQFAGTDDERRQDFQRMLDDKNVRAILCARGGYGTVRIIDGLDFQSMVNDPKWIVGYSDVTVLHNHLSNLGMASLHATMPINFDANSERSIQLMLDALKGDFPTYHEAVDVYRPGIGTGELVGGNLSILYSLSGTPTQLNTAGKILFLEDLDEHLYHVDRMMMNLKRTGMLDDLAGLIVGDVAHMRDHKVEHGFTSDNPFGKDAKEIIKEHISAYNYPVCFDFPAGHLDDNCPLVMGVKHRLNIQSNKIFLEPLLSE